MPVVAAAVATFTAVSAYLPAAIGYTLATLGTSAAFNAIAIAALPTITTAVALLGATFVNSILRKNPKAPSLSSPKSLTTLQSPASPARFVLGRARVRGAPVLVGTKTSGERDRDGRIYENDTLCQVIAINQGEILHVDKLIIAGQEYEVLYSSNGQKAALRHIPDYLGNKEGPDRRDFIELRVWDGSQTTASPRIRELFTAEWGADKIGTGVAYVLLCIRQNPFQRYSRSQNQWVPTGGSPIWENMVYPEFEIRGMKITKPATQTTMGTGYSENAADIWYWLMTQRGGVPDDAIDRTAWLAARNVCDQRLANDNNAIRYAAGGFIASTDDIRSAQDEILFAMQGFAPIWNGKYYLQPGANTTPTRTLTASDLISVDEIVPAPRLKDRVNAVTATLSQSRRHGFDEYAVAEVNDTEAQARDGERFSRDLGKRAFVNYDNQMLRLLRNELSELRQWPIIKLTFSPGTDFANLAVKPCDFVTLNLPDEGFPNQRCFVLSTSITPDLTVVMVLRVQDTSVYSDSLAGSVTAPLPSRNLTFKRQGTPPPAPTNLTITHTSGTNQNGDAIFTIDASVDATLYNTVWELTGAESQSVVSPIEASFTVHTLGDYTITAYHLEAGLGSEEAIRSFNINISDLSGITIPAPVILGTTNQDRLVFVELQATQERYITAIEIRASFTTIQSTAVSPAPTLNTWDTDTFLDLGRSAIVPSENDRGLSAIIVIPRTGRFRIFARYVDRWDRRGPITEVTTAVFVIPAQSVLNFESYPEWEGTKQNMTFLGNSQRLLVNRDDALGTLTFNEWDGRDGFPFGTAGDANSQPYFQTPDVDLGENKPTIEMEIGGDIFVPEGLSATVDLTVRVQTRSSGSSSWTTLDSERFRSASNNKFSHVFLATGGSGNKRYVRTRITMNDSCRNVVLDRFYRTIRVL